MDIDLRREDMSVLSIDTSRRLTSVPIQEPDDRHRSPYRQWSRWRLLPGSVSKPAERGLEVLLLNRRVAQTQVASNRYSSDHPGSGENRQISVRRSIPKFQVAGS